MIGYVNQLVDYYTGKKKAAQSVPASLFFRKGEENMGIVGLPFDLFISEKHKLSFKVGDHPLQNGSTISDHVHQELQEVTIEGMFSNFSMNGWNRKKAQPIEFAENYAETDYFDAESKPAVPNTALENLEKLRDLAKKKEPVRLVCSLDVYPKMIITDISYDRDEKSGSSVRFTVSLREIITVDLKRTVSSFDYPYNPKKANDRKVAAEVASGKRSMEELSADELAALADVEVAL